MPIKDFSPRVGDITNDPRTLEGWLDQVGLRQNIDLLNPLTTPASDDEFYILDVSTGRTLKITYANLLAAIGIGTGLLLTTATTGFPTMPTCNGTPTGVPAGIAAGNVAYVYDTSANKLWIYNGSWRGVVVT